MQVTIRASKTDFLDENPERCWEMEFVFLTPESIFEFKATEPYLVSLEGWKNLAKEGNRVNLYMGNGDGSITHRAGKYEFTSNTSGAGGDTSSCFTVNEDLVTTKLLNALNSAVEQGFEFSKK